MLLALSAVAEGVAVATMNGQLVLRPLTPGDVTVYNLPATTEASPGLTTVGIGSPLYLEADISSSIPPSSIVSVTWVLTNTPLLSQAFLTNSPLGTNIPVFDVSARATTQVAGRALLRPDVVGQYTVPFGD